MSCDGPLQGKERWIRAAIRAQSRCAAGQAAPRPERAGRVARTGRAYELGLDGPAPPDYDGASELAEVAARERHRRMAELRARAHIVMVDDDAVCLGLVKDVPGATAGYRGELRGRWRDTCRRVERARLQSPRVLQCRPAGEDGR